GGTAVARRGGDNVEDFDGGLDAGGGGHNLSLPSSLRAERSNPERLSTALARFVASLLAMTGKKG
ncbi:MAG: hypothetical protein Q8Q79_14600, partial [Sphingopyxis sp.]|nr:hypothetical protein [Sphingopyxis sp.]